MGGFPRVFTSVSSPSGHVMVPPVTLTASSGFGMCRHGQGCKSSAWRGRKARKGYHVQVSEFGNFPCLGPSLAPSLSLAVPKLRGKCLRKLLRFLNATMPVR